jgi:hypothetical protein
MDINKMNLEARAKDNKGFFKKVVEQTNPSQLAVEMAIYQTMLDVRRMYSNEKKSRKQEIKILGAIEQGLPTPEGFESDYDSYDEAMEAYQRDLGHKPAFLVVLNFDKDSHREYIENGTGLFENGGIRFPDNEDLRYIRQCIGQPFSKSTIEELYLISREDLATTLNPAGIINGTNVKLNPPRFQPPERRSYEQSLVPHGSRIITAQRISQIPGLVSIVMSEAERDHEHKQHIRRYQTGDLTYSELHGELFPAMKKLGIPFSQHI